MFKWLGNKSIHKVREFSHRDWVLSLNPGDVVRTNSPTVSFPEYKEVVIDEIKTGKEFIASGIGVKIKGIWGDSQWFQPLDKFL
jgi:hypothetical protein